MNKENASKLWKMIQEAGDYLVGQLPSHPNHPKGRNPYAHVEPRSLKVFSFIFLHSKLDKEFSEFTARFQVINFSLDELEIRPHLS